MKYELFYLVGEKNEDQLDAIRAEVAQILTTEGAILDEQELTEKRRLAYEIKHEKRGSYVTRRFDLPEVDFWADEANADKEFGIAAITNKLNLHTQILRAMIVKTSELPELGSKEVRKAREMKEEKQNPKKDARGGKRPERARAIEKPVTKKEVALKTEEAPAPKAEVKAEEAAEPKKAGKKAAKDIDQQLDELLNI